MDSEDQPLALGIVRWIPAYPKFVSHAVRTMKMSSFPLEIEKNIQAMKKAIGFYSSGEPEIEEILDGSPTFASHRSANFFGLFLVSGRVSSG